MITGIANILYGKSYDIAKRPISEVVVQAVAEKGVEGAIKQYRDLKASGSKGFDFSEGELNAAGYQLLRTGKVKK